jgi:hypothetical protein
MYGALEEQGKGKSASLLEGEVISAAIKSNLTKENAKAFGQQAKTEARKHAQKLRTWAEKGDFSLAVLMTGSGIALSISAVLGMLGNALSINPLKVVIECYLLAFGIVIVILNHGKYHIKVVEDWISKYVACMDFIWGRSLFCIFAGSLRWVLKGGTFSGVVGIALIAVGVLTLFTGCYAHKKLTHARAQLADVDAVRNEFKRHVNADGCLAAKEVSYKVYDEHNHPVVIMYSYIHILLVLQHNS